ncbi:unnamed protein product [Caenorhabditis angaria]|uniref:Uncharacterized protein n=1 Tax=Caenorhabditis angaria TaxID=860376 RepID=A0A9P1IRE5_9PELO|nr:unnamed protein product [Caenorhabditis angaria]
MCKILVLLLFSFCFFVTNAIVCREGYTLVNNKCIAFLPPYHNSGYYTSYDQCNDLGGNAVSIRTAIDNTAIAKLAINKGYLDKIWIGLECWEDNNPDDCIWADQQGNASRYNNFQPGNPQIDNGKCVYMIPSTGKWVSEDCFSSSITIACETDIIGACTHKFGDYCYHPIIGRMNHDEALNICEQMCGGSLVSIHSPEENAYIHALFNDPSIYIGAKMSNSARNYWSDGTNWNYDNINFSNINDGQCYTMSRDDGKWNSRGCEEYLSSVCKWKASSECQATCTGPKYREETGLITLLTHQLSYIQYRGVPPCYYVLHVPNGSAAIWFDSIRLDSKSSIEVYSDTGNSTPIAVITSENEYSKGSITSSGEFIKLVFNQCKDNCDVTRLYWWTAHFGMNYGARCGEVLYTNGVITSQNYPNNYPNNYNCTYYIQNPSGTRPMQIHFDHFETEENHDFVNIYNQQSGVLYYSLSGNLYSNATYILDALCQSVRIEFTTDGRNTFSGWSASFNPWYY